MPTYYIPVNYANPVEELAKHFLNKDALSEDKAIKVSSTELVAMGLNPSSTEKSLSKYPFIKEVGDRYWLSEGDLEVYVEKRKNTNLKIFFFGLVVPVVIAIIVLLFLVL